MTAPEQVQVTQASCGCGNEPVWGRLTFYDAQGNFIIHDAIRCLHCHYWFYINGEKEKTARRWNEAARHRHTATADALKAAAVEFNKLTAIAVSDARRYATADALEAMREVFERQTENMAFVINNVTMPDQWYEKLTTELAADRAAIATLEGDTK